MGVVDDLIAARDAFERREWVAAYEGLTDVAASELTADDYVRLATAAYLLGKRDDCVRAMQASYQAHVAADDNRAAIRCAFWLAMVLITGGEVSVGAGWVARAQRHLEHLPDDVVERGTSWCTSCTSTSTKATSGRRLNWPPRSPTTGAASATPTSSPSD